MARTCGKAAYWLVLRLREALYKTVFATLKIQQLRLRLLKIGGQVIQTARRIWFHLASGYPWKNIFVLAHHRLAADTGLPLNQRKKAVSNNVYGEGTLKICPK